MIAYIDGKLTFKDPTYVIVEANGVGYQIKIPLSTFTSLNEGERVKLLTYLHIKEDAHTLYGFSDSIQKRLFLDLISISGIGPNTALMMLSSLSPGELQHAIASEDVRTIQNIKGIGAKTAQRVILELKDKMKKLELTQEIRPIAGISHNTVKNEALSALVTLGIPRAAAEKTVDTILKKEGEQISLEQLIRLALKSSH
jgi:Holliday junction DNA helicase RuvA